MLNKIKEYIILESKKEKNIKFAIPKYIFLGLAIIVFFLNVYYKNNSPIGVDIFSYFVIGYGVLLFGIILLARIKTKE